MLLPQPSQIQYELPPQGTHIARCYRFIDLGTQPKTYKGVASLSHVIRIGWELPNELMTKGDNAGRPFSVSQKYTWSMGDKANLRKMLESWRGRKFEEADFGPGGFDTKNMLGKACLVNIINEKTSAGNDWTKVVSVTPPMKDYPVPPAVNPVLYFSFAELEAIQVESERMKYFQDFAAKISPKMADDIRNTPEFKKAFGIAESDHHEDESFGHASQSLPDAAFDQDTPF